MQGGSPDVAGQTRGQFNYTAGGNKPSGTGSSSIRNSPLLRAIGESLFVRTHFNGKGVGVGQLTKASRVTDLVLVGGGVLSTLTWLYFIYYYVWTKQRSFTSTAGAVLYLVLPGLLATVLFVSLRFRRACRVGLALFFLSMTFSIYAADLLLLAYRKFDSDTDRRSRHEVIVDLRNEGIDAVPPVFAPSLLTKEKDGTVRSALSVNGAERLPLAGIARKLTVLCNESGPYVTYRSDEHGFNNPDDIWNSRNISIAAVGDSFALGSCVPSDMSFVDLIRKSYPATLNLGINGAGPLCELAAVKEYLSPQQPSVVLWFYYEGNDLSDLSEEKKDPLLMHYLEDAFNQGLITRQNEIDETETEYIDRVGELSESSPRDQAVERYLNKALEILKVSALREQLGLVYGTITRDGTPTMDRSFEPLEQHRTLFHEVLRNVQAKINSWGGELDFVYLPSWVRYSNPQSFKDQREAILAEVRNLNIPIIDIHQTFKTQSDPLSLFPHRQIGHYNEAGHRLVAETVLNAISRRSMTPYRSSQSR